MFSVTLPAVAMMNATSDDSDDDEESISEFRLKKDKEDADEVHRRAVFDSHVEMISMAQGINVKEFKTLLESVEPLSKPITRFSATNKKRLPSKDGTNIFEVLHKNKSLSDAEKCELMNELINSRNYKICGSIVLQHPYIDYYLKNDSRKLHQIYFVLCNSYKIPHEIEIAIWNKLIDNYNGASTVLERLINININTVTLLGFIDFWFNSLNNSKDIINAYQAVKATHDYYAMKYLHNIREMAELRILNLDFATPGQTSLVSKKDPAYQFLKSCHSGLFSIFSHHSSFDIYKLMQKNKDRALSAYKEEQDRLEGAINSKITKSTLDENEPKFHLTR